VHADAIVVRRGVDQELVDQVLASQPSAVLEALARQKIDALEFLKAAPSGRNPPGQWRLSASGRREIWINTSTQGLDVLARSPDFTVSTKVALRAAKAEGASAAAQARVAKLAKIRVTVVHEIGHQVHGPAFFPSVAASPLDREVDRKIAETFRAAKADGSAARLSTYATTTRAEFFAEAFSAYFHAPELLDTKMRDMVETVLKLRKGPP
jgi:hypothetical protein